MAALDRCGCGLHGIIPRICERGNRNPRKEPAVYEILDEIIAEYFLKPSGCSRRDVHTKLLARVRPLNPAQDPSYRFVTRRIDEMDPHYVRMVREGKRAAMPGKPPSRHRSPLGSPHGCRPFTATHADHTQLEVSTDHPDKRLRIEKPWVTHLVDAFDGMALAWVIRMHSPDTDTAIALMRDCVARHGRLPSTIVLDWGPDFRSEWLQTTMAEAGVTIIYRPKAEPRGGSPVENGFSTAKRTLTDRLEGTTKLLKNARQVTDAVDPRNFTLWTLSDLAELLEKFYTKENDRARASLAGSPNQRMAETSAYLGIHPANCISKEALHRLLLPTVRGLRKVSPKGTVRARRNEFSCAKLANVREQFVRVRYDPGDETVVYVSHPKIGGCVKCETTNSQLKYAKDRYEAATLADSKRRHAAEIERTPDEGRIKFEGFIEERENEFKRHRRKKPRSEPPGAPRPGDDSDQRVVPFSEGMVAIAKEDLP